MADNRSQKPSSMWNIAFIQLLLIQLFTQFGANLVRPIVSNYAVALGAAVAVAGFVAGINSTTSLVFRLFAGRISDRFAKRSLLVVACTFYIASSFGCALIPNVACIGVFYALH